MGFGYCSADRHEILVSLLVIGLLDLSLIPEIFSRLGSFAFRRSERLYSLFS